MIPNFELKQKIESERLTTFMSWLLSTCCLFVFLFGEIKLFNLKGRCFFWPFGSYSSSHLNVPHFELEIIQFKCNVDSLLMTVLNIWQLTKTFPLITVLSCSDLNGRRKPLLFLNNYNFKKILKVTTKATTNISQLDLWIHFFVTMFQVSKSI